MLPPMVSFITWNRLGLTCRNLSAILASEDDFELYLADSNSHDNTWEYLMELKDPRIKAKVRFDVNRGPIYAVNYHLSKRKENQLFITVDNDVYIRKTNWVTLFTDAFRSFPEVGLLGAVSQEYMKRYNRTLVRKKNGNSSYLKITSGFVEGCCQCLSPQLLDLVGYWNEECCVGDMEICHRIIKHTPFCVGFIPAIEIEQPQVIACSECSARTFCTLINGGITCFDVYKDNYRNPHFRKCFIRKYQKYIKDLDNHNIPLYSGSIHDGRSLEAAPYNRRYALENFNYYIEHSN